MDNTVAMQILYSDATLISQLLDAILRDLEVTELNVVEQIFTLHVLKNNIVVVRVLEEVNKRHNVGMLRHLEHVYFSTLLVNLNLLHVLLVHGLDGDLLARLFMSGQFDEAELALAQIILERVVIEQVRITDHLLQLVKPIHLLGLGLEVQDARLVGRQNNLARVQLAVLADTLFWRHLLDECADHRVHYAVLRISRLTIAVQLVADEHGPMLLVAIRFGLEEALALEAIFIFVLFDVAEAHERLIVPHLTDIVHVLTLHAEAAAGATIVHSTRHSVQELRCPHALAGLLLGITEATRTLLAEAADASGLRAVNGRELTLQLFHFLGLVLLITQIDSVFFDFHLLPFVESL